MLFAELNKSPQAGMVWNFEAAQMMGCAAAYQ